MFVCMCVCGMFSALNQTKVYAQDISSFKEFEKQNNGQNDLVCSTCAHDRKSEVMSRKEVSR